MLLCINFPYYYRLMAIWVQNVENMGYAPEHPAMGCCLPTVGNFSWWFSVFPCRRQCNVALRLELELWTRSVRLKAYGGRGAGSPPSPLVSARVSYIKKWNDPRPPLNGFVAQFAGQRASNETQNPLFWRSGGGIFVQNLKKRIVLRTHYLLCF